MTIRHLKIFIEVYKKMSITKAAKELHMAQPAVSRSIQELEKYYDIVLFDRLNHRIYPTDKANEFYAYAVQIVDSFDIMEKNMRNGSKTENIYIGGTMTIGNFVFPKVISEFNKMYPMTNVKVTISNSTDIQKKILDNQLDLAIVEENVKAEYLETEYFSTDHMCLIFGRNHILNTKKSIGMKEIVQYPVLLREKGSATRTYLEHIFAIHDVAIQPIWESTSTQALINAVANDIGISILPERLVHRDLIEGHIATKTIRDEKFKRKTYFIWHRQKIMQEMVREFKDVCRKTWI